MRHKKSPLQINARDFKTKLTEKLEYNVSSGEYCVHQDIG